MLSTSIISIIDYVYIKSSFKAFESLKLLIFPCGNYFLSHFPKYWQKFANKNLFLTSTPLNIFP